MPAVAVLTCDGRVWLVEDSESLLANVPLVLAVVPLQGKGVTSTSLPFTPQCGFNSLVCAVFKLLLEPLVDEASAILSPIILMPSARLMKSWTAFCAAETAAILFAIEKDNGGGAWERITPILSADNGSGTEQFFFVKRLCADNGLDSCRGVDFVCVEVATEERTLLAMECKAVVEDASVVAKENVAVELVAAEQESTVVEVVALVEGVVGKESVVAEGSMAVELAVVDEESTAVEVVALVEGGKVSVVAEGSMVVVVASEVEESVAGEVSVVAEGSMVVLASEVEESVEGEVSVAPDERR